MIATADSDCLARNDKDIAYRIIDGEAFVVNLKNSVFHVLNEVATVIWQQLDGETSIKNITKKICQEFDVDYKIAIEDCRDCIRDLQEKNIVIVVSN